MTANKVMDPISSLTMMTANGSVDEGWKPKYQVMLTVQFSVNPPFLPSGVGLIVEIVEITLHNKTSYKPLI